MRAAAPHQKSRRASASGGKVILRPSDLRVKVRERKAALTLVFVLDSSGSMGVARRMSRVKAAVLSLLEEAYRKRDKVALVVFKGGGAEVLLGPTPNVELAHEKLKDLPSGGRTPLAEGLSTALELMERETRKDPQARQLLVLVTDGRPNGGDDPFGAAVRSAEAVRAAGKKSLVVDTEEGWIRLGGAARLASVLGAECLTVEELQKGGRGHGDKGGPFVERP